MADTVYKLTHTGAQIDSAIDNAVRSDAQILTSEQQTQARTNIGAASAASAASAADLTTETNARITADTGVRGLTATVEATSTASQAYAIGSYFVYNGLLYKCTAAIAQGGTITPGTNCTATTAGAEISTLNQNLTGYNFELTPTPGNYATNVQNYSKKIGAAKVIEVQFDVKADTYTGWEGFFWLETAPAMNTALSCIIGNTSYPCSATIDGKINICINGAITFGQIGCIGGVIV